MKRKIFSLAIIAAFAGSMAMGCSSTKKAGGTDSTGTSDTGKLKAPMDTASNNSVDTAKTKMDTTKKDTLKKP